jgi:hypothetical protein
MDLRHPNPAMPKWLMASGSVLLAIALLADLRVLPSFSAGTRKPAEVCETIVSEKARLSRLQLAQLLTIAEGDQQQRVREIVKEPYCKLPSLQVRTGATAQREAYPMEFDPQTWLIVLYEGDQYAGYRFDMRFDGR